MILQKSVGADVVNFLGQIRKFLDLLQNLFSTDDFEVTLWMIPFTENYTHDFSDVNFLDVQFFRCPIFSMSNFFEHRAMDDIHWYLQWRLFLQ